VAAKAAQADRRDMTAVAAAIDLHK
jgi:hypothetical protein